MDSYVLVRGLLHCENKLFAESDGSQNLSLFAMVPCDLAISGSGKHFDSLYNITNLLRLDAYCGL